MSFGGVRWWPNATKGISMGSYYRQSRPGKKPGDRIVHYYSATRPPRDLAEAYYGTQAQIDRAMENIRVAIMLAPFVLLLLLAAAVIEGAKLIVAHWQIALSIGAALIILIVGVVWLVARRLLRGNQVASSEQGSTTPTTPHGGEVPRPPMKKTLRHAQRQSSSRTVRRKRTPNESPPLS